ncbi:hypothetical protein CB0940_05959 [Cercospora beticola]|uniref:J domain-containing protein n=2 Tax=Cercospora beticola TaxID=122368 RepID=A0A2G5HZJ7_CERBT|nr:hypothetical protein CB0940_05959 [Cercospora beticola]PIA97940.1 hypothetical protein CB0940_05959 [Cercospora beticola]
MSRNHYRDEFSQAESSIETLTASISLHDTRIEHRRSRRDRQRREHERDQELMQLLQEKAAIEDLLDRARDRAARAMREIHAEEARERSGRRMSFDMTETTFVVNDNIFPTTRDFETGGNSYSYLRPIYEERRPAYERSRPRYEERRPDYARDTLPTRSPYDEPAPRSHRSRHGDYNGPDDYPPFPPQNSRREEARSSSHRSRQQESRPEPSRDARQGEPQSRSQRSRYGDHLRPDDIPRGEEHRSSSHRSRQEESRSSHHESRSGSHRSRHDDDRQSRSDHSRREESRSHRSRKEDSRPNASQPKDGAPRTSTHHKTSSSSHRNDKPSSSSRSHTKQQTSSRTARQPTQYATGLDILNWYASLTTALSSDSIPKLTKFPYPPVTPCTTADCTSSFALDRMNPACDCSIKDTFRTLKVDPSKEKRRFHPDKFSAVQDSKKREEMQNAAREVFVVLGGMSK